MKKKLSLILALAMALSLCACGAKSETTTQTQQPQEAATTIRVGAMTGPTAMGMVKLMSDSDAGSTENTYEFTLDSGATTFVSALAKGDLDMAAVPSNVAATIYNNTDGAVEVMAVNTLGVLYVVERGDSVQSVADLKGKTIYATGQGAVPEYTLDYLLTKNGLDPTKDVTIQWCADTTEALSYIAKDSSAIAMLPQPFVTVAQSKVEGLRVALSLNDEWQKLENSDIVTGVVVVRKDFAEQYPQQTAKFLEEYQASVEYTSTNASDAAALIANYEIVPSAAVAETALPECGITFVSGADMKTEVDAFLNVLYFENPQAIGGKLPDADFYYGAEA
ncbi:MAG: MqnA/MqnD/SBP family protein [Oscillospiraceae bacterium]|nr:MqnA/MqnD/SBP family protein [Oscillospiraceae bacterium]